jgi:N-acetylmuramoyl-L-alanine amidase
LDEILDITGSRLEWEPNYDAGRIIKGGKWVTFKVGVPYICLGFLEKIVTENVFQDTNGSILFQELAAEKMIEYLAVYNEAEDIESMHIAYILIDPGHGGKDPGAIGTHVVDGEEILVYEKDVVLQISQILVQLLEEKYPHKKIFLTREDDTYLDLESRTNLANSIELEENEAIIFISIHANASFSKTAKGFEIWYLPPEYERQLISLEDVPEEDRDILAILDQMLEVEYLTESIILANNVLDNLDMMVGDQTNNRGLKQEKWFVVSKSKMPSILIEVGFVTNYDEGLKLKESDYLRKLATGIYNGIHQFITLFEETEGFIE